MQDEVNEKTIALYIKTGKLTAQTLQKAMKAILSKGKKQLAKPPQGKQSLKQLMKQNAGVSNIEITEGNITFYCSPFLLDMSTLFYQLTKIIHMYMLTTSRFFCIVLLKGGKCLCYIACVFDKH